MWNTSEEECVCNSIVKTSATGDYIVWTKIEFLKVLRGYGILVQSVVESGLLSKYLDAPP